MTRASPRTALVILTICLFMLCITMLCSIIIPPVSRRDLSTDTWLETSIYTSNDDHDCITPCWRSR